MEAHMPIILEDVKITSYQLGVLDNGVDAFDFSQLTTEPTAPAGEVNHSEFAIVKRLDPATPMGDGSVRFLGDGLLLPAVQDDGLLLPAVQTGGISVASGDVNGDNSALGDPVTFTLTIRPDSAAPGRDGSSNTLMIGEVVQTEPWTAISMAESSGETGAHDTTDGEYVLTTIQHASPTEASIPATAHVAISLGDGKAIEAAGDNYGIGEWSDPAQSDGGTNMSPWTTTHSSNSGNRANPDTFDCSELTQWASARGDAAQTDTSAVATLLDFEWDGAAYSGSHVLYQDVVIPAVQTDNGLLLPAVQDDGLLLPAVQTDDAFVFTAIALAESGGNSEPHAPHGEDSLGLFQINVEPNQYDPDAFANDLYDPTGPAVATETLTIVHEGFLV
jgi:lysozyme-like protein